MGMLDDAFISDTRKKLETKAIVPYGAGREGTTETPMVTPPPRMSKSVTLFKPKQVTVEGHFKERDSFDFNDPFKASNFQNPFTVGGTGRASGSNAPPWYGAGQPVGSSAPLGSSAGVGAGRRHAGRVVGSPPFPKPSAKQKAQKIVRGIGGVVTVAASKPTKVAKKAGVSLTRSFNEPRKKKERAAIGKQARKGIHKTLFRGKHRLI